MKLIDGIARCLLRTGKASALVDIDPLRSTELRRIDDLPALDDVWFTPSGHGLGKRQTAAIGQGPTVLTFIDPGGTAVHRCLIPDAASEIAAGEDLWYVGCRDGRLYGFGFDGIRRWEWEMSESNQFSWSGSGRPCPLHVAANPLLAAVGWAGHLYAISPEGQILWHNLIPQHQRRRELAATGYGLRGANEACSILGVRPNASHQEVRSAYRRLAFATHPDRNPGSSDAALLFRRIRAAYDQILGRAPAPEAAGRWSVSLVGGHSASITFVTTTSTYVATGSSSGALHLYDLDGRLRRTHIVGTGGLQAGCTPDGASGALLHKTELLFFNGDEVIRCAKLPEWPRGTTMVGDAAAWWTAERAQIIGRSGDVFCDVKFSRRISGVASDPEMFACAAGVLAVFRGPYC